MKISFLLGSLALLLSLNTFAADNSFKTCNVVIATNMDLDHYADRLKAELENKGYKKVTFLEQYSQSGIEAVTNGDDYLSIGTIGVKRTLKSKMYERLSVSVGTKYHNIVMNDKEIFMSQRLEQLEGAQELEDNFSTILGKIPSCKN